MIQGVINKGAIFLVRETGRGNRVARSEPRQDRRIT